MEEVVPENPAELTDEEFEALADQLADEFAAAAGPHEPLPDEALRREAIYEDHPKL